MGTTAVNEQLAFTNVVRCLTLISFYSILPHLVKKIYMHKVSVIFNYRPNITHMCPETFAPKWTSFWCIADGNGHMMLLPDRHIIFCFFFSIRIK